MFDIDSYLIQQPFVHTLHFTHLVGNRHGSARLQENENNRQHHESPQKNKHQTHHQRIPERHGGIQGGKRQLCTSSHRNCRAKVHQDNAIAHNENAEYPNRFGDEMGDGHEHRHANQHAQKLFSHHSHRFIAVRVHHQERSDGNPCAKARIHIEQHELRNRKGHSNDYAKLNRKPKLRILKTEVVLDKVQSVTNTQSKRCRIITRCLTVAQRVHHRL